MYHQKPLSILHRTSHHNPRKRIYFENPTPAVPKITLKTSNSRTMVKGKKKNGGKKGVIRKRIPRAINPRVKVIRVKCSDYIPMSCTSGAISRVAIQGNSCDDPFAGNGTIQPLGYDQWKALYKSAYVIGAKVNMTVHNTAAKSIMYGITPMHKSQGTTTLSSYEYYNELPKTRSRLLSPDVDHGYLSSKTSTKKHMHRKNLTDENDLKVNLVDEIQPADIFYFHAWVQPTDQTTTVSDIECVFTVEYIVLLTDPVIPTRSVES